MALRSSMRGNYVVIAAVVLIAGSFAAATSEGQPASAAMQELKSRDPMTRGKAVWKLRHEGNPKDVVPVLARVLASDRVESVRAEAAAALGEIGPAAVAAVPSLLKALRDRGEMHLVNREAVGALTQIGAAAIPELESALCEAYGQGAGKALGQMGSIGFEPLRRALRRPGCRRAAAIGVGVCSRSMGSEVADAIPDLIAALSDEDPVTRSDVVRAIGQMGTVGAAAVPALTARLRDIDGVVRLEAILTLGAIGPGARAAVPALRELLTDSDAQIRLNAQATLRILEASK